MARRSGPITLSAEERIELDRLIRSHSTAQQLARRARMIMMAADGVGVGETAQHLGVWRKGVSFWRAPLVGGRTAGRLRSGLPMRRARAHRRRSRRSKSVPLWRWPASGRTRKRVPISQWSAGDLAREAVRRGIVTSISPRSVGRFLKRIRPQAASGAALAHAQARS